MDMMVTPIIVPISSEPDPCENCNCPCHEESSGYDAMMAVIFLISVAYAATAGFFQFFYHAFMPVDETSEIVISTLLATMMGGLLSFVAMFLIVGVFAAIAYLIDCIRR